MKIRTRPGITLFQLLLILAFLAILLALLVPAVQKVREAAARAQSSNNLKQIALAALNYHDANAFLPSGNDDGNYSAATHLLPYIEQGNVYNLIDFKKPMDAKDNAEARKLVVRTYITPRDSLVSVSNDYGATNYLFNAGSKPALADNDGVFYQNSKTTLKDITDGTANTLMAVETLKGDNGMKAMDMHRQHVALKKDDLKGLKDESGVKEWKDDKNIAADRCMSWMDGRFLQGTFTATRAMNDAKPDVNCAGFGGLSGVRIYGEVGLIGLCDGSVRTITKEAKLDVWKALATRAGNEEIPNF
jgi:Tfp pilus assembly protein PilE